VKLGIVVHYSSNDRWLWDVLRNECMKASSTIVVVRRTHLFDGTPESNEDLGERTVVLPHDPEAHPKNLYPRARLAGVCALPDSVSHVLLLDSDEIPEGERLANITLPSQPVMLAAQWYWRVPTRQAIQHKEHAGLLSPIRFFDWRPGVLGNVKDRKGMLPAQMDYARENPFMHHFSWVRNKAQMLVKIANWSHKDDRPDWKQNVEKEWSGPISEVDFVHGYRYRDVPNQFNLPCSTT
jgi:hypothetical protein